MTADTQSIVEVEGLSKSYWIARREPGMAGAIRGLFRREYREVKALEDVSFCVKPGELIGYIGPNGAGKSTTVKILSGILVPDTGRCQVLGRVPWEERIETVQRIGVVFGQRTQLWWDLPVQETFELLIEIYRLCRTRTREVLKELQDLLDLGPLLDVPVRQLSLGQRMRCDLAAALIHEPRLLFLDEPTIGLDAVSKLAVRDFVKRLNRDRGVAVILTTHDLDDIEALCDRVLVLGEGKLLIDGSLADLRSRVTRLRSLTVDLVDEEAHFECPGATIHSREGHRVHLRFDPEQISTPELIGRIVASHSIRDLFVENPPIEEIVARLYGDYRLDGSGDARGA